MAAVQVGVTRNLTVTIERALATPTLYLLLHRDAGQPGVYEFPGPDAPIIVSNPPMLAFRITGLPGQSRAPATLVATQRPPVANVVTETFLGRNEPVWLTTSAPEARLHGQGAPGAALQVGSMTRSCRPRRFDRTAPGR